MFDDTISWFSDKYNELIAWLEQSADSIVDGVADALELPDFWKWLGDFGKAVFTSGVDFVKDAGVFVVKMVLAAVSALLNGIPAPSFLTAYTPEKMVSLLSPEIVYVIGKIGFVEQISVIGSAISFLLIRKLLTLGRW